MYHHYITVSREMWITVQVLNICLTNTSIILSRYITNRRNLLFITSEVFTLLKCSMFFLLWPLLPSHWRHLITLNNTHIWWDSPGRGIDPSQRPLADKTQHLQQIVIHANSRIRTRNPSKRVTSDPRFRRRGYRDAPILVSTVKTKWPPKPWCNCGVSKKKTVL